MVASASQTLPEGISDAIGPDNFSLTELLNEALSKPSFNQCRADVLTGGFISMGNESDTLQRQLYSQHSLSVYKLSK